MAKKIGLVVVALAVVGIVTVKASARRTPAPAPVASVASVAAVPTAPAARPSVVLVADPREADAQCPCGEIIRRVRAAKANGVMVEELAPDSAEAGRLYGVTIVPTVVFLDADRKVVARREGESTEILAAITADLMNLEGARK